MLMIRRILLLGSLSAISFFCIAAQNSNGRIQGTVTMAGSSEPIANVNVNVRAVQTSNVAGAPQGTPANVQSDDAGHFGIDLPPGRYTVTVTRAGFGALNHLVGNSGFITTTDVSSGKRLDLNISLLKLSTITGRITDSSGQPVTGVRISVLQVAYQSGKKRLQGFVFQQSSQTRTTDDRGEYRITGLDPGAYYLAAEYVGTQVVNSRNSFQLSYYPGTTGMQNARSIEVEEGGDFRANFQLLSEPAFKASGRLIFPNSVVPPSIGAMTLVRIPEDELAGPRVFENQAAALGRGNGNFEIRNVPAGRYRIYVSVKDSTLGRTAPYYIGSTQITIQGDLSGISLPVHPEAIVKGKIVGSQLGELNLRTLRAQVQPKTETPFAIDSTAQAVAANGDVVFSNIPDGQYFVQVTGMPPNMYISDIRQAGRSVLSEGFAVSNGVSDSIVEIVLNSGAATVSGTILRRANEPAAGVLAVLVPAVGLRQNYQLYRQAIADHQGRFSFEGIPQGDYTLFSWDKIPPRAYQNAEFLSKYEAFGTPLQVSPNSTATVQLQVIDKQ